MTCPTCNDLHPSSNYDYLEIPIHKCLETALKTSCDTCQLLSQIVHHFDPENDDTITIARQHESQTTLSVAIYADLDEDDIVLDLFVPEGKESGHALIGSSVNMRTVLSTSLGEESLQKVTSWIDECDEGHSNCNFDMLPMPTRVINVGLDGETPFLMDTEGETEWYATLSYCWGITPQVKTTKARLEQFKEALPMEELSLVAKDAIALCQGLSIPYLWIDALCIVQDDEEDWLREAGRMCDVYASSYLTIAAAGTSDNTDGIFQDQWFGEDERMTGFPFRGNEVFAKVSPYKEHLGHPLGLNFEEQYADRLEEKSWLLRPQDLPLIQRAWTVQERILSRRVIYYTREELWWECDSAWHCECGFADEEKYPAGEGHAEHLKNMTATQDANRGAFDWLRDPHRKVPMTLDDAYHKWCTIITMFAAGGLTYAKDKLPALSGLAQQFKRMLQDRFDLEDEYFAGMWRHNIERQLLWIMSGHVTAPKPLSPRPLGTFAPTWSWMSVNGNVHFTSDERDMDFKPRFRILEVSTELVGEDWAGRITGGKLILEAFVVHGLMLSDKLRRPYEMTAKIRIPSTDSFALVTKDIGDELEAGPYTCLYAADLGPSDEPIEQVNTEVGNMFFLLKASGSTEGAYERVGIGLAALHHMTKGLWDNARQEVITIV